MKRRTPKRGPGGRFKKKARRAHARKNPVKRTKTKRTRARRAHAPRRAVKRAKRRSNVRKISKKVGQNRKTGKFVKRRRHAVRAHARKVPGTRKRRIVKRHMSYEAAAENPTKPRRRRRRRAAATEETTMKRPRRRRSGSAPKKRRHARRAASENPTRRRRKRRAAARENPAPRRRRPARRRRARRNPMARSRPAKSYCRTKAARRRGSRVIPLKRKRARRRGARRAAPMSPQLTMFQASEGYAMENPMGGMEMGLAVVSGTVGFFLTGYVDRWMANKELGAGGSDLAGSTSLSPAMASLTKPGIKRVLAQLTMVATPFAAAYWAKGPKLRAGLQGAGLGAAIHLAVQAFTHFALLKMVGSSAADTFAGNVNALYSAEGIADNNADVVQSTTLAYPQTAFKPLGISAGATPGTIGGIAATMRGLGAPNAYGTPVAQRQLARPGVAAPAPQGVGGGGAVGDCGGGCGGGDVQPPPPGNPADCGPCAGPFPIVPGVPGDVPPAVPGNNLGAVPRGKPFDFSIPVTDAA